VVRMNLLTGKWDVVNVYLPRTSLGNSYVDILPLI
jgi:hypothetical protein